MISLRKISALYSKNMKNVFYNPFIIVLPILMVLLAFLFGRMLHDEAAYYETILTMIMLVGMNILLGGANTMATLIAEEREKNTLGVLVTSTVSVLDFLTANILTTATLTIAVNIAIYFIMPIEGLPLAGYLIVTSIGTVAGITLGATLGLLAKNQSAASTLGTPLMAFTVLPAVFSDNFFVDNVLYYFFTEQIGISMIELMGDGLSLFRIGIIAVNFVVFVMIFGACYRKRGLAV